MATILSMPKWGLAMKTGRVVEWLKQPGDSVQQGEPIVQIESEKAVNEVESPATGTLRWLVVKEDESAPVSAPLAVITTPGEELSDEQIAVLLLEEAEARQRQEEAQSRQRAAPRPAPTHAGGTTRTPAREGGRVNASPAARRLAQELGVDLTTILGTGPQGMIGREDVLRAAAAEEPKLAPAQEEERMVDVDGVATHCLIAGPANAPHVVLVHGLGGSLTTWALNLAALSEQFRICALDLVGAGDSAKPATDYSVLALAAFLARFLDALGPEWRRVSLVGHSLGGSIILTFAQQHPERVERLVIVDSAGLGPNIDARVIQLMTAPPDVGHIRAELASFFADPVLVQQALVDQIYQQRMQPGAHEALVATAEAAFAGGRQRIDLRPALATLSSPLLAIWGAGDSLLPIAHAHEASRAPRGRVKIFEDCAHCPHIERSDAFNQLVISFLKEP
jgi:pimeloyl-ACP methyl ester carboxylesterase